MIARRVLVNFRVDPDVARRLVPPPLGPSSSAAPAWPASA